MSITINPISLPDPSRLGLDERYTSVIQLWTMRILLSLDNLEQLIQDNLPDHKDPDRSADDGDEHSTELDCASAKRSLEDVHARLEASAPELPKDTTLSVNIAHLGDRLRAANTTCAECAGR